MRLRIDSVRIGRLVVKKLPSRYILLYIAWFSRGSRVRIHRLPLVAYLMNHILQYDYEEPPIISNVLLKDVESLINEGAVILIDDWVQVTDVGRAIVGELYGLSSEYVNIHYLVIRVGDLLRELSRLISVYQDMDTTTLLSLALSERATRCTNKEVSRIIGALARDLRTHEGLLG